MSIVLQSYKFESNSQPTELVGALRQSYKVTNLKAIHNAPVEGVQPGILTKLQI